MRLTLADCTLAVLSPSDLRRGSITVDDGRIVAIGVQPPDEPGSIVPCSDQLVMPGNVCAHTHLYSALARGMPPPPRNPRNFREILELIWWRLDRALDDRSILYSGLIGAIDAARAGTTTLVDHHASPNAIDGSLDIMAEALNRIGLRGVLCYEVTDRGGQARRDAGLRENSRFLGASHRRLRGAVGAHASFTLEDETLTAVGELAAEHEVGVHIHVAEDIYDQVSCMRDHHVEVADRLGAHGVLQSRSILAHGIHLHQREIERINGSRSWLVHNCRSNLNNSVGRAQPATWGERKALGTDGIDGDMFAESRTAFFRGREEHLSQTAEQYAAMLARGGELASEYFGFPVGALEVGAAADLIVLNYDPPTPLTAENLAWHWMFGMTSALVDSVMVDGDWVLRNREIQGIDEEKIRAEARLEANRLWIAMEAL